MTEQAPPAALSSPVPAAVAVVGPASSAEAAVALSQLAADPVWAAKLLKNSPAEVQQMRDLVAAKVGRPTDPNLDLIMVGDGEPQPFAPVAESGLTVQDQAAAVIAFREAGLSDGVIREVLTGAPVSKAEQDAARRLYADKTSDASGWVSRLLKGGAVEKRELTLLRIILGAPLKVEARSS